MSTEHISPLVFEILCISAGTIGNCSYRLATASGKGLNKTGYSLGHQLLLLLYIA
jgi:hypothetical protein